MRRNANKKAIIETFVGEAYPASFWDKAMFREIRRSPAQEKIKRALEGMAARFCDRYYTRLDAIETKRSADRLKKLRETLAASRRDLRALEKREVDAVSVWISHHLRDGGSPQRLAAVQLMAAGAAASQARCVGEQSLALEGVLCPTADVKHATKRLPEEDWCAGMALVLAGLEKILDRVETRARSWRETMTDARSSSSRAAEAAVRDIDAIWKRAGLGRIGAPRLAGLATTLLLPLLPSHPDSTARADFEKKLETRLKEYAGKLRTGSLARAAANTPARGRQGPVR